MARQRNQPAFDFATFVQELKNNTVKPAQVEVQEERRYFLIVSEGIRTEPLYFEYLSKKLPPNLLDTIDIHGEGDNTINVVRKAIELRAQRKANKEMPPYDEVWAVYDKDDFPQERYHLAIELAHQNGIESGHSNQSFELWYILHFAFLQAALHRDDYINSLYDYLGFRYLKNDIRAVEQICTLGNVRLAIRRARELEALHEGLTPAQSVPFTRVYELVERLRSYMHLDDEED